MKSEMLPFVRRWLVSTLRGRSLGIEDFVVAQFVVSSLFLMNLFKDDPIDLCFSDSSNLLQWGKNNERSSGWYVLLQISWFQCSLMHPGWKFENHLQKCLGRGYVSSQQGRYIGHEKWILLLAKQYCEWNHFDTWTKWCRVKLRISYGHTHHNWGTCSQKIWCKLFSLRFRSWPSLFRFLPPFLRNNNRRKQALLEARSDVDVQDKGPELRV